MNSQATRTERPGISQYPIYIRQIVTLNLRRKIKNTINFLELNHDLTVVVWPALISEEGSDDDNFLKSKSLCKSRWSVF
jgi:hypothetical protein